MGSNESIDNVDELMMLVIHRQSSSTLRCRLVTHLVSADIFFSISPCPWVNISFQVIPPLRIIFVSLLCSWPFRPIVLYLGRAEFSITFLLDLKSKYPLHDKRIVESIWCARDGFLKSIFSKCNYKLWTSHLYSTIGTSSSLFNSFRQWNFLFKVYNFLLCTIFLLILSEMLVELRFWPPVLGGPLSANNRFLIFREVINFIAIDNWNSPFSDTNLIANYSIAAPANCNCIFLNWTIFLTPFNEYSKNTIARSATLIFVNWYLPRRRVSFYIFEWKKTVKKSTY